MDKNDVTTAVIGCLVASVIIIPIYLLVCWAMALLAHWAFPALHTFQYFVALLIVSMLLSILKPSKSRE